MFNHKACITEEDIHGCIILNDQPTSYNVNNSSYLQKFSNSFLVLSRTVYFIHNRSMQNGYATSRSVFITEEIVSKLTNGIHRNMVSGLGIRSRGPTFITGNQQALCIEGTQLMPFCSQEITAQKKCWHFWFANRHGFECSSLSATIK